MSKRRALAEPVLAALAFCAAHISTYSDLLLREFLSHYWQWKLGGCGKNLAVERFVVVHAPDRVIVGDNVHVCEFVHMWGGGGIRIGNDVIIASHTAITSLTHNPDTSQPLMRLENLAAPVVVGNNVWIGSGAIILPGVTIHSGAVIGAGAVVRSDVAPDSIVAGVPAKLLRIRVTN